MPEWFAAEQDLVSLSPCATLSKKTFRVKQKDHGFPSLLAPYGKQYPKRLTLLLDLLFILGLANMDFKLVLNSVSNLKQRKLS